MITALYRKSSNEVIKISLQGQLFTDSDTAFWGVLTDPTLPDGNDVRDNSGEIPGPLRILGFAKIAEVGTNTVRNATGGVGGEIETFDPAQLDDRDIEAATRAEKLIDTHPQFRRAFIAMMAAVEDLRPPGQRRTKSQLVAAAKSKVHKDD